MGMQMVGLADIVRTHAIGQGAAVALVHDGRPTTYGHLHQASNRVAQGLIAEGIRPQSRVAHLDKSSDLFFDLLFGVSKVGAVMVSVNWRLAAPEVLHIVNDADAEILFVGEEFFPVIDEIRDQLRSVREIVALSGVHPGWEPFARWRDRHPNIDPQHPAKASDTAVQFYTSGTTGLPKGAELTNSNFASMFRYWSRSWQLEPGRRSIVCLPMFHIGGAGWGMAGLYAGATNYVVREFVPAQILDIIQSHRIEVALFVPAMILFLLQAPQVRETDLSSLQLIVYGAAPIPAELLKQAMAVFGCGFQQVYGLTETTGAITLLPTEDHDPSNAKKLLSCGYAQKEVELRIIGDDGRDLPPGEVGEIAVRSPQVMGGYWKLPDATARAVKGDWFLTGDAGYLDDEGYLYIYDRVKDMIVSGGENIYPAEVESALFGHPAVADVAVIGVPDERWGEAVKAVVVTKPGSVVTAAELIDWARSRIAGYKLPKSIDFIDALPRNPTGKILKRELRKAYWSDRTRQVN
ncbi:fatty-acyl-CoA synthase [Enhydrobacter aerosaccus]|uniref:3-methylmercaptopropionyl-CoA ligase n=1 Tax=Enhydrobacter aerosaccus TaxID=225324 RepID=A0A1T4RHN8_9HYPH|nr:fatty acid--CoA ligase [Enhydrobacter aerosaccus]SKA15181.1 fatty-acyl-CoA synthase [Enhydrobacter aerosaccus]